MVLYDIARESLLARSAFTKEPTDSDAIMRECNRIMVLNGYADANLDGKSGIGYARLPKSWNSVSWGQEFKLYGEGDLAKFAQEAARNARGAYVPDLEIFGVFETPEKIPSEQNEKAAPVAEEPIVLFPDESVVPVSKEAGVPSPEPGSEGQERRRPSGAPVTANSEDFFICQFRDKRFNPRGPLSSNDCGPASLAMIARYYDAQFSVEDKGGKHAVDSGDADPADLVSDVRFLMTGGRDSKELTSLGQIERAAEKMGFSTSYVDTIENLDAVLDAGKMVVLSGNPKHYQKDLGLRYGLGGTIYDGGHFVTVVRRDGDNYIVNDPASHGGPLTLSREQLDAYMRPGDRGLAVYA
ncbi:MAG TPA: C39 family peptidase [Candidatus Obscuribacterales bacterium]